MEEKRVRDTEKALVEIRRLLQESDFPFKTGTRDFISVSGRVIRPSAKTFLIDVDDKRHTELCELLKTWGKNETQKGITCTIRQCNFSFDEENWGYPEGATYTCEVWIIKDPTEQRPFGLTCQI